MFRSVLFLFFIISFLSCYTSYSDRWLEFIEDVWEDLDTYALNHDNRRDGQARQRAIGAVNGALNSLDDPYSAFLDAERTQKLNELMEEGFGGIGAQIMQLNGATIIYRIFNNSPAEYAGLEAFDEILAINSKMTKGQTLGSIVTELRGPEGEDLELLISRAESGHIHRISITRKSIASPNVQWLLLGSGDVGYIRLGHFSKNTANHLREILSTFKALNIHGIILDVRGNPGGLLDQALAVSNLFVCQGPILEVRGRNPSLNKHYYADPEDCFDPSWTPSLHVLIDRMSASASEILAASIQASKRGKVVGSRSFGKASVQHIFYHTDPEDEQRSIAVRITVARYYTASGALIDSTGIQPDINVEDYWNSGVRVRLKNDFLHYIVNSCTHILPRNLSFDQYVELLWDETQEAGVLIDKGIIRHFLWDAYLYAGVREPISLVEEHDPVLFKAYSTIQNEERSQDGLLNVGS